MKRYKRHKVKEEKPEASTSHSRHVEEYDLAYYIHDRVELMHQVFSVLRPKDLKSMAPECVRHVSIDDLQELCTEELLGISSKRLCAILDGAEPPSDTESSSESPERMETISLDSISSDEEILSETSKKSKKHKRHRRDSKTKKKKKTKDNEPENGADADKTRASRAGLTVLELLELQARARAIRAQLQQEQAAKQAVEPAPSSHHSSDNEVEIKEEPAEVVEISSEDEKPKIEDLRGEKSASKPKEKSSHKSKEKTTPQATEPEKPADDTTNTQTVTKRINDLIITVPQVKQARKIKLNRSKISVSDGHSENNDKDVKNAVEQDKSKNVSKDTSNTVVIGKTSKDNEGKTKDKQQKTKDKELKSKDKEVKAKGKKKKHKKVANTSPDSDHDEITLQLSDTEKMDLLEDLDRKNFDKLSSSDSEDSESSSSDSESQRSDENPTKSSPKKQSDRENSSNKEEESKQNNDDSHTDKDTSLVVNIVEELGTNVNTYADVTLVMSNEVEMKSPGEKHVHDIVECQQNQQNDDNAANDDINKQISEEKTETNDNIEITSINDLPVVEDVQKDESISVTSSPAVEPETSQESPIVDSSQSGSPNNDTNKKSNKLDSPKIDTNQTKSPNNDIQEDHSVEKESSIDSTDKIADKHTSTLRISVEVNSTTDKLVARTVQLENIDGNSQENISGKESAKELSEGELSDKESSDIEAVEIQPEVVCISDDESDKKSHKKKKKKEKKSKNKKAKKSKQDFREGSDQNFFKETENNESPELVQDINNVVEKELISLEDDDYDDVYEILELSDDSSCFEVEGTVLSKEPTAEEIAALSAKIDEIEREDIVTEEEIREHERRNAEDTENIDEFENVSWKDRYLDSKKVKKVLTTSSIFNALRKKNRELKKKLEESKQKPEVVEEEKEVVNSVIVETTLPLEEGSIEHYKTLQGSTKYVDPVPETDSAEAAVDNEAQNGENENAEVVKNGETNGDVELEEIPQVAKEIKKDAKQLLKMYKRLMKYNDMNKQKNPKKQKDPNKKKKKKSKKKNDSVNVNTSF